MSRKFKGPGTRVYGRSDDLVEIEGEVDGESGAYGTHEDATGVLVIADDGTILEVKYGKAGQGIWAVTLVRAGALFDRIEPCTSEDADIYSDIAYFKPGLKRAWCAKTWEVMK